jgi:hypothetical protein
MVTESKDTTAIPGALSPRARCHSERGVIPSACHSERGFETAREESAITLFHGGFLVARPGGLLGMTGVGERLRT